MGEYNHRRGKQAASQAVLRNFQVKGLYPDAALESRIRRHLRCNTGKLPVESLGSLYRENDTSVVFPFL